MDWVELTDEFNSIINDINYTENNYFITGKAGTGKTTFADIIVDIWCALGIAKRDRYIKTTRSDWIGKYQG